MSKSLTTIGMAAFLAVPAFGQHFYVDGTASSITIGLSASGVGTATFAVDSSPLGGWFRLNNPGAPLYSGPTTLIGTTPNSSNVFNLNEMNWELAALGIDLTTKRHEFEILGFNAPEGGGSDFFPGTTPGVLAGGPPASGSVLTEMLAHLASNGSAIGAPVTLNDTAWIPPIADALATPAPFTVTVGPDGSLGAAGSGPDEALLTNSFWIDFGDVQAQFMLTILGDGSITPEPATMSLLGLGGLALVRRVRRKVA